MRSYFIEMWRPSTNHKKLLYYTVRKSQLHTWQMIFAYTVIHTKFKTLSKTNFFKHLGYCSLIHFFRLLIRIICIETWTWIMLLHANNNAEKDFIRAHFRETQKDKSDLKGQPGWPVWPLTSLSESKTAFTVRDECQKNSHWIFMIKTELHKQTNALSCCMARCTSFTAGSARGEPDQIFCVWRLSATACVFLQRVARHRGSCEAQSHSSVFRCERLLWDLRQNTRRQVWARVWSNHNSHAFHLTEPAFGSRRAHMELELY